MSYTVLKQCILTIFILGLVECKTCADGQVEDRGFLGFGVFKGCDNCPKGTFQSGYNCEQCSHGFFSNHIKQTKCQPCPSGKYSKNPGSLKCASCQAGEFSNSGAAKCEMCPAGMYSRTSGSESCLLCPGGSYSSEKGSSKCTHCPDGKTSPSGSESPGNCTGACSAGHIHTVVNSTVICVECRGGEYSLEGALECTLCQSGTFSVHGSGSCTPCRPGTFAKHPGVMSCKHCPPGTISLRKTGNAECTACPKNTQSNFNNTACLTCPRGGFSQTGAASCATCPEGYYLARVTKDCWKCPGNKTSKQGSYTVHDCYDSGFSEPTIEPVSTKSAELLTSKHIVGVAFTVAGIVAILGVILFIIYWIHQRMIFERNLSGPKNKTEKIRDDRLKTSAQTPEDYSSC